MFIPRNAPALFNLFAFDALFWDGRVSRDVLGRFHTPAGAQVTPAMEKVFEFGPASALPMFPVTSRTEMRAFKGNELAAIDDNDFTGIWAALMRRLGQYPEYVRLFEAAYPGTKFSDMTFAYAANAMGGFMTEKLSFTNSPWDRFLGGDDGALTDRQLLGAEKFLSLKCSICHNGPAFSDRQFHNVAIAQIGPGEGDGFRGTDDFGRMRVTGDPADRYRFRTTPLRNVELTGPYGHDGAIVDLRTFVAHYSESGPKLMSYDPSQLESVLRASVVNSKGDILVRRDTLLNGVVIPPDIIDLLTEYMRALTDGAARNLAGLVPARVPSGLPVDR